ncbi:hypothetical protein ACEZDB_14515 [Streptacidiphilus sp. N1-3]|uniref:Uncharacterized protein n=1 Tax=Streptacidiphilus alkalitolerans TaxID=3342712 RepID=A0ABV6X0N2_9ACTN
MNLKALGYWKSDEMSDFPDPLELVDSAWDSGEREIISDYLCQGQTARTFMGSSRCRLCGKSNGSSELTDGEYIWPSGLGHYVMDHSVRLPAEFVQHVFRSRQVLDEAEVELTWWMEESARFQVRIKHDG